MEINDYKDLFQLAENYALFDNFDQLNKFSHKIKVPPHVFIEALETTDELKLGVKISKKEEGYTRTSYKKGNKYYTYKHLATTATEPSLMPLHCTVHNTDVENFVLNGGHDSKEIIYVLKGSIRMHWEFSGEIYSKDLNTGDSVYIKPGVSHSFVAIDEEAELLAFNY